MNNIQEYCEGGLWRKRLFTNKESMIESKSEKDCFLFDNNVVRLDNDN